MKHVGEAIRTTSTLSTNDKIVVLGIASWTMVKNNEKLIKKFNVCKKKILIYYFLNKFSKTFSPTLIQNQLTMHRYQKKTKKIKNNP
jgi:hypothetical protein